MRCKDRIIYKFLNFLIKEKRKFKNKKNTIASGDIVSYQTNKIVKYSGKYHNYCIKLTIEITTDCVPVSEFLGFGSEPDSLILDKMLSIQSKLPYELYLDKGYEKYKRRRDLSQQSCQV